MDFKQWEKAHSEWLKAEPKQPDCMRRRVGDMDLFMSCRHVAIGNLDLTIEEARLLVHLISQYYGEG